MPIRRVDPNGLTAALMLAFLATAGFFYVNIMAAIVSGLVDGLHFTARDAGRVGACNIYGAAAGAFFAVLLVRRVHWRRAALALLSLLIVRNSVVDGDSLGAGIDCGAARAWHRRRSAGGHFLFGVRTHRLSGSLLRQADGRAVEPLVGSG